MLRCDGQEAIVTGAGRGLGRAHALLLAERGASVVVNDLGGDFDGTGEDAQPAEEVVQEILAAGGRAVANIASVADPRGAESIVQDAMDHFGRLDIVVNNAGIIVFEPFPDSPLDIFTHVLGVHLHGSFNVTRAAWPHLVRQEYGRVVLTTSGGALGSASVVGYASAKGALISLGRSLAQAGQAVGIKVNMLAPIAITRTGKKDPRIRAGAGTPGAYEEGRGRPESVSPIVAVLAAHRDCPRPVRCSSRTV